uniref:Zinc-finger double domain protein n=1 Tax=Musca domestica TaxID=7370 RepID=A0A1I8N6C0_MUSDO
MDELSELEACRICVKCYRMTEMDFIYLFHDNDEFQKELDFIRGEIRQWNLKIAPDDGLPQRICADCFAKFCSIEAFRKECEAAQNKLLQSILNADKEEEKEKQQQQQQQQHPLLSSTAANDVLNDYQVFDPPQFDNFNNSPTPLMDSSATLLDNNLITTETDSDMGFLSSSQNLFSFETAEPPTTGTLPSLDTETENHAPSMEDIMNTQSDCNGGLRGGSTMEQEKPDLEDILQSSIIPTTSQQEPQQKRAKLTVVSTRTTPTRNNVLNIFTNIKTDKTGQVPTNRSTSQSSTMMTSSEEAATTSDNECDDANVNKRLKNLPYTCHYCYCPDIGPIDHLSFPNEDALSQHFFDIHDPNRPYTCPHCSNSYKTQRLRDNHVRLNHEQNTSKCHFCHKNIRGSVEMHQTHCQHLGDWECDQCKERFHNMPLHRFRLHQRQHERGRHLKCSVCHRSFSRKANLDAHEKMHRNQVKSQWHCEPCKTNFLTNYDLRRHNYQHHDDESPVKCKECNQGFSSIAFMQRHISQIHNNNNNNYNKPHVKTMVSTTQQQGTTANSHFCPKCNVSFASLDSLQWHIELSNKNNGQCLSPDIVLDNKERRRIQRQGVFPCFVCPKRFHLRSQLDKHLNTHDTRLRPFQCDQCYTRCRTALELKQHVDVAHLNIKAFACEKCGKTFGYKKDLNHHMLFHAEISVHCTEDGCDYVCKNEKALNDHKRHKHRLLSCEYCREEFTRQKLTAHLRNVHRAEINIDLAGNADNFYKSKLLNNNNDITQISFNLINTQNNASSAASASSAITNTTTTSSNASNNVITSLGNGQSFPSTSVASGSTPLSSPNNHHVFITDHNSNNLTLNGFIANATNDLNLGVNPDTSNSMYVVTTATETPITSVINEGDNNLDQYFMASLMDTEQEIIVT